MLDPFCQSLWTASFYASIDPSKSFKAINRWHCRWYVSAIERVLLISSNDLWKFYEILRSTPASRQKKMRQDLPGRCSVRFVDDTFSPLSLPAGLSGPTYPLEAEIENLRGGNWKPLWAIWEIITKGSDSFLENGFDMFEAVVKVSTLACRNVPVTVHVNHWQQDKVPVEAPSNAIHFRSWETLNSTNEWKICW